MLVSVPKLLLIVEEGMPVIRKFESCSEDILKVSYSPWFYVSIQIFAVYY